MPHRASGRPVTDPGGVELSPADFTAIAAIMMKEARIHLPANKQTLVQSRLTKRLRHHGIASFADYIIHVRQHPEERHVMVEALTTNHTHFFRENHHYQHFASDVLPGLKAKAAAGRPVRIWSAGSSSGEEIYALAMLMAGNNRQKATWLFGGEVRLLATDIAPAMIDLVRRAEYPASAVEPVPVALRQLWLERSGDHYRIAEPLRRLVQANVLNLFAPWPMQHQYDVIFCRNVMIYFDDAAKEDLELRFIDLLWPGGHLYIGHSERLIGKAVTGLKRVGQTVFRKPETAVQ
ncbi:MAG: hypothetical protein RIS17_1853 [Pseudomonadota bacterium]|jgi:chemotaxis protein methyltransferase CheR